MHRFGVELRAEVLGDVLRGHAAVFGQMAEMPNHWEAIGRHAFDAVLDAGPDVRALVNHDPSQLLGRTPNTLRLDVDRKGLSFEVDLPDTRAAADLRVLMSRGDITGASFAFIPGEINYSRAPDGYELRTHTSIAELLDVSVVTYPAYKGAGAQLRSMSYWRSRHIRSSLRRSQLVLARSRVLFPKENHAHDR